MTSNFVRLLASPRGAILLTFATFGVIVGLWAGSVPEIARRAAVGKFELGFCLSLFTATYVLAMWLGPRLSRRIGNRRLIQVLLVLALAASVALFSSTSVGGYALAVTALGGALSLLDLFMNSEASAIESDLGRPVFAAFHGAASLGTAVAAITGSLIALSVGPVGTLPLAAVAVAMALWRVTVCIADRPPAAAPVGVAVGPHRYRYGRLVKLGIVAGLAMAAETASVLWSAKLLDEQAPSIAALAGAGAAFFGICHAAVRFAGDRLRARFGDLPLIVGSLAVAAAGYAGVGLSTSFAASVVAFALTGIGSACVIPVIFSLAASEFPESRAAGIGVVGLVAGPSRIVSPWIFGALAESLSTAFAFGIISIAVVAGLLVALTTADHRRATA